MSVPNMQIRRYITWPGQATAYAMGERAIRAARRKREEAAGDEFDLRGFHRNVILCGGPVSKLEECLAWREERAKEEGNRAAASPSSSSSFLLLLLLAAVAAALPVRRTAT